MGIFGICFACMRVSTVMLGSSFTGRCIRHALRHHFDFFASGGQCILCGTNDLLLALPVGHFQSFLEGFDGGGIFGAVGQQSNTGQAQLALG